MERRITERLAAEENERMQQLSHAVDLESELAWAKLLELASERPGALTAIAKARAPEASQRVLKVT